MNIDLTIVLTASLVGNGVVLMLLATLDSKFKESIQHNRILIHLLTGILLTCMFDGLLLKFDLDINMIQVIVGIWLLAMIGAFHATRHLFKLEESPEVKRVMLIAYGATLVTGTVQWIHNKPYIVLSVLLCFAAHCLVIQRHFMLEKLED